MVPTRTLPIVVDSKRGRGTRAADPASLLRRLAASFGARRRRASPEDDAADLVRLDRALELIEHQTCDCV